MYHSKKIGVFVSHIYGRYQSELCQGIIDKASSYGYLVDIFSSNDGENLGYYGTGENSILRIPNYDKYVGIIFASGTYPVPDLKEQILADLKEKCSCPIVEVTQFNGDFPTIMLDNDSPIGLLVEHLISEHHFKRICYLGNTVEKVYSDKRFDYYKHTMATHNLSVSEYDQFSCDYQYTSIEDALNYFLRAPEKPDAIVCYNDRMALHMMAAIRHLGYGIPKDIAVTGCDTLDLGQNIEPKLTSVSFPIQEIGTNAIDTLLQIIDGEAPLPVTVVKAAPYYGTSCGCPSNTAVNPIFYNHNLMNQMESMEQSMIEDMNMSATLQGITDIDEGMEALERYISCIDHCKEIYLCLYNNWDYVPNYIRKITNTEDNDENQDTIILKYAMKDGKTLPECSFHRKDSLPEFIYKDSTSAYIYSPLFFGEYKFGYVAISYEENHLSYRFNFMSWLMNVSSMLKNICDTKHIGLLVNRLEHLHMRDELTSFYNSHGFYQMAEGVVSKAHAALATISATVINLDGLRVINSTYGTEEGRFAVQIVGNALESSLTEESIAARFEGGRFYILNTGFTNDEAIRMQNKVRMYLDNYNKLQSKNYTLSVSCGHCILQADSSFYLPNLILQAEKIMYEERERKKKLAP